MGAILTPIVYLTMQYLLQIRVDFPGHDVAISDTVFCLFGLASIAESTPNRMVTRNALRLTSRSSLRARSYARSERWARRISSLPPPNCGSPGPGSSRLDK